MGMLHLGGVRRTTPVNRDTEIEFSLSPSGFDDGVRPPNRRSRWNAEHRGPSDHAPTYEELKQSESYFQHLSEHSLDLITILDVDGTIRFESESIRRMLGHDPRKCVGKSAFDFVHPDDRATLKHAMLTAVKTLGKTPSIRFRFIHANGMYRVLEGAGRNMIDDPVVGGIVFNTQDITDRMRLQEEVERARTEKEETISMLTGGVAHDFNNILTAVQGLAELAGARMPTGSAEAGYIDKIESAVAKAAELTQQLLAFSHHVVLRPCMIELKSWIDSIQDHISNVLGPSIELRVAVHKGLRIWEDPEQLEQVLLHLAMNARDAMPYGGRFSIYALPKVPEIRDPLSQGDSGQRSLVQLTVADGGMGMSEEILSRIFQPYFTTKTDRHHSGLGLCMCRGIVEQSGGHVTVHSQQGVGTVIDLLLPSAELHGGGINTCPSSRDHERDLPLVLFVDDEPMLRELGETILTSAGCRVILAEDGASALAQLEDLGNTPLHLLITDVVMPGMTGLQLVEEAHRLRPNLPIILCSGYTHDTLEATGGTLPSDLRFVQKPYTSAALREKVAEIIDLRAKS